MTTDEGSTTRPSQLSQPNLVGAFLLLVVLVGTNVGAIRASNRELIGGVWLGAIRQGD